MPRIIEVEAWQQRNGFIAVATDTAQRDTYPSYMDAKNSIGHKRLAETLKAISFSGIGLFFLYHAVLGIMSWEQSGSLNALSDAAKFSIMGGLALPYIEKAILARDVAGQQLDALQRFTSGKQSQVNPGHVGRDIVRGGIAGA